MVIVEVRRLEEFSRREFKVEMETDIYIEINHFIDWNTYTGNIFFANKYFTFVNKIKTKKFISFKNTVILKVSILKAREFSF